MKLSERTIPRVLKHFNIFVNNGNYAGIAEDVTLPKIAVKTETIVAAMMDVSYSVFMSMEDLTLDFNMLDISEELITVCANNDNYDGIDFVLRGVLQGDEGKYTEVEITCNGIIKDADEGSFKSGEKGSYKFSAALASYKLTIDKESIYEIDSGEIPAFNQNQRR